MPKLPVFATIGQAMAVFGLHFGKIFKWALIPVLLGGGAVGATFGLAVWKHALGVGWNIWLVPIGVAIIFAVQAGLPLAIRINQLAVLGRVEKAGYMEMIFSPQSFRYLGYACIVSAVLVGGILLACVPAGLGVYFTESAGRSGATSVMGILVSLALGTALVVLTMPLNLVFPAVAVESEPSLVRSYNLGVHCKFRLFWSVSLSAALFVVLTTLVGLVGEHFGMEHNPLITLILMPVNVAVGLFSWVTSLSVPAVAYRILTGLPNPQAAPEAGTPPVQCRPVGQPAAPPVDAGPSGPDSPAAPRDDG
jgi:hypothetical protein